MADFNQFGASDEENAEISKLTQEVVWIHSSFPEPLGKALNELRLIEHIGSGYR